MKLSTRNQFKGTIKAVKHGNIVSEVVIEIAPGILITSVISKSSAENLQLEVGAPAYALIKSTEVTIAVD